MISLCINPAPGEPDEKPCFSAGAWLRNHSAFRLSRQQAAKPHPFSAHAQGGHSRTPGHARKCCNESTPGCNAGQCKPLMTWHGLVLLAVAGSGLGACAWQQGPAKPPERVVTLGHEKIQLTQITESTWTASAAAGRKAFAPTPEVTAFLRQAVESASGCTVTDSDYSRHEMQFDAQVSCAGSPKN